MKKQIGSLLLACAIALVFTGCCTAHHAGRWEYQTRDGLSDADLNKLVADGWRLDKADYIYKPDVWVSHYLLKREIK